MKAVYLNIDLLNSYLINGNKSSPVLYINSLNLEEQTIDFDFCFPVNDNYVYKGKDSTLYVDQKPPIKGKSQSFFGNYSESHRGWFKAIQRLEIRKEKLDFPFLEKFYDSPFSNLDDLNWHSEIYFSVKHTNNKSY